VKNSLWENTIQTDSEQLVTKTIYLAGMLAEECISSHARDAAENAFTPVMITTNETIKS